MNTNIGLQPTAAITAFIAFWVGCVLDLQIATAQEASTVAATDAIIDGSVVEVFQSGQQRLVQVFVRRSEATQMASAEAGTYPAPGQSVYVHVGADGSTYGSSRNVSTAPTPKSGDKIRAFLSRGSAGQWNSAGEDWYQDSRARDIEIGTDATVRSGGDSLGLSTQPVALGTKTVLKVLRVDPGSPAAAAGIEPGDVIVAADRLGVQSQEKLNELYKNRKDDFSLTVRDVRSGQDVSVPIDDAKGAALTTRELQPLGVKAELAFFNGSPAVKVTEVAPRSPAQQAGLTPGLLILNANGKPVESTKDLEQAERSSRGRLKLTVVDPKNKRETVVRVTL